MTPPKPPGNANRAAAKAAPQPAPLTDAELDRVETFLASRGDEAMSLEMLDGFFAALVSGPDPVQPADILTEVWGDAAFDDPDEARTVTGLVTRHWNAMAAALLRTLQHDEIYEAFIYEDEEGRMLGNDWATGFLHGAETRAESWEALLEDDDDDALLNPMRWLDQEDDPDPELQSPPIEPEQRDELLGQMLGNLTLIYRHFAKERGASLPPPKQVRRNAAKVGRNDPCPCGSGRKFKHCCGKADETVH